MFILTGIFVYLERNQSPSTADGVKEPERESSPRVDPSSSNPPPSNQPSSSPSNQTESITYVELYSLVKTITTEEILNQTDSPQNAALLWTQSNSWIPAVEYNLLQRYAIATIYYALDGENWNMTGEAGAEWLTEGHECGWKSITCENNIQNVTGLDLSDDGLKGTMPNEITALSSLQVLRMNDNAQFIGEIPYSIGDLDELKVLHLHNNNLVGRIPESIGNLTKLEEFAIDNNELTGLVPQAVCDLGITDFGKNFAETLGEVKCSCCSIIPKFGFSKEFFGKEDGDKYGHAISLGGMRLAVASEQYVQTHEYNDVDGFVENPLIDLTSLGGFSSSNSKHGMCLSDDGNRLAVGFTNNHTVFILDYHADKQNWTPLLEATPISNEAGVEGDMFGEAVAFSQNGTYLAVGAPNHSDGMGRVYVYKEEKESTGDDTMSWSLLGEPIDGNVPDEKFGHAVSISASGNTIAIAGSHVYVFAYENEEWSERWDGLDVSGNVSNADDEESKHYSISLSSDGKYLAVGDPLANGEGNGSKRGCASVYGFDENVWLSYGKVEGTQDEYKAGFSVALSSDAKFMVVGTPGQDSVADFPGNAMVYDIFNKKLIQVLDGTLPGDNAGYSVAITADGIIAVGAPGLGNDGRGYVHTYQLGLENVLDSEGLMLLAP